MGAYNAFSAVVGAASREIKNAADVLLELLRNKANVSQTEEAVVKLAYVLEVRHRQLIGHNEMISQKLKEIQGTITNIAIGSQAILLLLSRIEQAINYWATEE